MVMSRSALVAKSVSRTFLYWYREQRKQGECRKLLMHMQQMRSARLYGRQTDRHVPSSFEVR